jgi:hypothetical protein
MAVSRRLPWFLLPFITVFVTLFLVRSGREMSDNRLGQIQPSNPRTGKLLFVMVDSLSASIAEDPKLFPSLERLRPRALWGRIAGCLPASTVACTRTMLEGSNAGYVASLDNFAARRAGGESFPLLARAQGLKVAIASDHTFTHMLGGLGGPRVEYLQAGVPVYGWDEAGRDRAREWLAGSLADVVLVHLVDLDKASHSPGPGTPRYAKELHDADAALADMIAALGERDSLIVAGDHGHDEHGNHTPDPGYLAYGPPFAPGRIDIEQATIALLLSAAADTPLPPAYDGEVPAGALRRPFGGSAAREAAIRVAVQHGRDGRRSELRRQSLEFMPGLAVSALILGSLFPSLRRKRIALGLLGCVAISAVLGAGWASLFRSTFWLGPPANFLNYLALFAVIAGAVAFAMHRLLGATSRSAIAAGLLAFPMLVHFTGDDYFAPGRTLFRMYSVALTLVLFDRLKARERDAWLALGASIAALVLQELRGPSSDGFAAMLAFGAVSAAVLYIAGRDLDRRARIALALVPLVLSPAMRHPGWATLMLALLALPVLAVTRDRSLPAPLRGLFASAAVVAGFWASLGSLRFERVRFEFALAWLPTVPNEARLAAIVTPIAVLKYALIVALPLSLAKLSRDPGLQTSTAWFSWVPSLSAAAFVAGASSAGGSRYHETAIQEACLYAVIGLLTLLVLAVTGTVAKLSGAPAETSATSVAVRR